jgi:hypothetical protein
MDQSTTFDQSRPLERTMGGSMQGLGGAAAMILAILGLVGVLPEALASVAVIAIGLSLLVEGGAVAAQYSRLLGKTAPRFATHMVGSDVTMEAMSGLAGVVLGILALLHVYEMTLLAASVLLFGGALLMASVTTAHLSEMRMRLAANENDSARVAAQEVAYADSGSEKLIGAGAVVLGILALSGLSPLPLVLVGLLGIGASVLLNGISIGGRIAEAVFRQ